MTKKDKLIALYERILSYAEFREKHLAELKQFEIELKKLKES